MKIYKDKKYVKLVPRKYKPIEDKILKMVLIDRKRLLKEERLNLEICLLKHEIKNKDKYAYKLIKDGVMYGGKIINRISGDIDYVVLFKNRPDIRCSKFLIDCMPPEIIIETNEL